MQYINAEVSQLAFGVCAIFVAALIRGYSGFGFSALSVASLTFVFPPVQAVPIILMLEVAASIGLLKSVWRDVEWRSILWLCTGTLIGTPIGIFLLINVPETAARISISLIILMAAVLLLKGYRFKGKTGATPILGTGIISGSVNGVSAAGGLPVVIMFLASSAGATTSRASVIVFFLLCDTYASTLNFSAGLIDDQVFYLFLLFLIPLGLGVFLGNKQFVSRTPETFRKFAIWLLFVLAVGGLLQILYAGLTQSSA